MSTKPTSEDTPDLQGAYPRLSDAQIAALAGQGRRRVTRPGEILLAEGDRDCDFFVVLAGTVASVEGHGTPAERVIAVHGRGRFLGELSLLTGEGSYYAAVALDTGEDRFGVRAIPTLIVLRHGLGRGAPVRRRPRHIRGITGITNKIARALLDGGILARYAAEYPVTGLTSNPTIFPPPACRPGDR